MDRMKRFNSVISVLLFGVFLALYVLLLLYTLLFKNVSLLELFSSDREYFTGVNVIPFHTIRGYLSGSQNGLIAASNILGNIVLFVPLGLYLQLFLKNKKIWISLLTVFLTTLLVETVQFLFGLGAVDIDDVILNTIGGLIGILLYRGLFVLLKTEEKVRTAIVAAGFAVILIPVLAILLFGFRFRLG